MVITPRQMELATWGIVCFMCLFLQPDKRSEQMGVIVFVLGVFLLFAHPSQYLGNRSADQRETKTDG